MSPEQSTAVAPQPRRGVVYQHFVCLECGNVWKLPANDDERGPWCSHGDSYMWRHPVSTGWTRMVRALVFVEDKSSPSCAVCGDNGGPGPLDPCPECNKYGPLP